MHQSKKGPQWYFDMKAHIGVDAESGVVQTVRGTAGNVNDVIEANALLHGQEASAYGDSGYQGADKRPDAKNMVRWHIAPIQGHFTLPISRSDSAPASISVVSSTRRKRPSVSSSANRYTSCETSAPSRLVICTWWRSA